MSKERYKFVKIDKDFFLVFDSENSDLLSVAQCRSEDHVHFVVNSLNRCNELDKTEWVKK